MVAPVTGPFVKAPTAPFSTIMQKGYRQHPPYNLALEYEMSYLYGRAVTSRPSGTTVTKVTDFDLWSDIEASNKFAACNNLAYERLRSKLGSSAGWLENLAQINKTRRSIVERAVQIASVAKAVRKYDFIGAARALRTPVPSGVSNRKAISQNFLEFEYGWKPLFKDLVESADLLTTFTDLDIPLFGSAKDFIHRVTQENAYAPGISTRTTTTIDGELGVRMGAVARIVNPNLFLANQLGVIDFALPWKLIPFSFVVDWFVNVEQVISSISDWYGVQLLTPYTTRFSRGTREWVVRQTLWNTSTGDVFDFTHTNLDQESVHMRRWPTISMPTLTMKPFKGFSLERGSQAIALVLSVLGK